MAIDVSTSIGDQVCFKNCYQNSSEIFPRCYMKRQTPSRDMCVLRGGMWVCLQDSRSLLLLLQP